MSLHCVNNFWFGYNIHYLSTFLFIGAAILLVGISFLQPQRILAQVQQSEASLTSTDKESLLNGISFQIDNVTFSHHIAPVNGNQIHYVIGGQGDPVVLLHGWPETWYSWHHVMPALAPNYTVIAPDLPGLGDSSKPATGYDGKTVADVIHQLVTQLGFKTIFLVGHDIGTQVAYSYASVYPTEVRKLVVMELTIPGFIPQEECQYGGELFIKYQTYQKLLLKERS
jgi:hypothetical protein